MATAEPTSRAERFFSIEFFPTSLFMNQASNPLQILGVLHGKRNVARILRQRL